MGFTKAAGRAVFGGFFLYNGINHLKQSEALAGYAAAKQVDYPHLAVKGSGVLLIASGLSVMLGIRPQWGAAGIALFLTGVSPKMHDFWKHEDAGQKQNEMIHFSKNMALLGAAIAIGGAESSTGKCCAVECS